MTVAVSFVPPIAAVSLAVALLAGMVGQSLAYHLRLPGIVILLLFGVVLGPDGFHVINAVATKADILASFAIAVILFEAGTNVEWKQLRAEAPIVRKLVTLGAVVTWLCASVAVKFIMGWDVRLAILFGSVVVVTGTTAVSPLLRRIRLKRNLQTILEGEGVFIDAIGATLAIVTFDVVFASIVGNASAGALLMLKNLGIVTLTGFAGAGVMVVLLRSRKIIPAGMEKTFTLALAWATFLAADYFAHEGGMLAVLVAGIVFANIAQDTTRSVRESKEQLSGVLVGAGFVLIAASHEIIRPAAIGLGLRGVAMVAALMFIVRPLCVLACTARSELSGREKALLSWIAPRGIVAASLVAIFSGTPLPGIANTEMVLPLVVTVIVATVLVDAFTGTIVAGWLGVRRPRGQGYVILGGNPLAVALARVLKSGGEESVLIDANPSLCSEVEAKGFRVLHGNALDERIMERADIETRKAVISLLPNDGVNLLFARRAVDDYRADRVYVAMHGGAIKPAHISEIRGRVLFGSASDVDQWASRLGRGEALVEEWNFAGVPDPKANPTMPVAKEARGNVLPLAIARGATVRPIDDRYEPKKGDVATWLLFSRRDDDARAWLRARGWVRDGVS